MALSWAAAGAAVIAAESWCRAHEFQQFEYVPDLLFARPRGWSGAGWVERATAPPRSAGAARIVCVGDSVTEGLGVSIFDAWPSRLAAGLGLRWGEVWNFGTTAWDPDQTASLLETRLGAWQPDVVVWGTYPNDLFPNRLLYDGTSGIPRWVAPEPPPAVSVFPQAAARWLIPRSALYRLFLAARYVRSDAAHANESGGAEWYGAQVRRVERWSQDSGVPVVIFAIPPHAITGRCDVGACETLRGWYEDMTGVLRGQSLPWVDGLAALEGAGPFFLPGSTDLDHPNSNGHRRLAAAVAPRVAEVLGSRRPERALPDEGRLPELQVR